MHNYEVAFPLVGIGYLNIESAGKLSQEEAIEKAYELISNGEQLDDYNWEVFLKESDASPFSEAQVVEEWED